MHYKAVPDKPPVRVTLVPYKFMSNLIKVVGT